MVEDKYSSNWRTSQKTNETYSYLADIINEELKTKVEKHYSEKSKDIIEQGDYYYFPIQFEDKDTKKPVQMVYRFIDKEKAVAKANAQGSGGNKQFAPRKIYYETFEQPIPVPLTDYAQQAENRAKGMQILSANLVGSNGAVFYDPEGKMCILMGKVFKVEL
jgi:hypothetical protein